MKKINMKRNVAGVLDLPGEYVLNTTGITLSDFSSIKIINYKSIVEYGSEIIRINTNKKIIRVSGRELNIDSITDEEISISGDICGVNFE